MKRMLLLLSFLIPAGLNAQQSAEIGFMAGGTTYHGDIGYLFLSGLRPATGGFFRYNFNFPVSLRANLLYGSVGAKDKIHPSSKLNFKSALLEYSFQVDVFLSKPRSKYRNYSVKHGRRKYYIYNFPITSYVFIGVGQFHFNPKGKHPDGNWYALQPLCTEGQEVFPTRESRYSLSSVVVPVGAGIKVPLQDAYMIGLEMGFRKTFTDYLDDVSLTYVNTSVLEKAKGDLAAYFADPSGNHALTTSSPAKARGNPKNMDAYFFAFVTLQYDFSKVKKKKSFRI